MNPSNLRRLCLLIACSVLVVVDACSGSSFSASPSESGGADADIAGMAGSVEAGGALGSGANGSGGATDLGGAASDGGSAPDSGAGGLPEMSPASAGEGGADLSAAASAGAAGECNARTWFPDADQDGFGRASGQVLACEPPAQGHWTTRAGDCNDDNVAVSPKEVEFKSSGYTASSAGISFDYDCSTHEDADPSQLGAAPACASLTILNCAGEGFANTARTGPGVNPLCGSTSLVTCTKSGLNCVGVVKAVAEGVRCR
jgi:hypothetical protein